MSKPITIMIPSPGEYGQCDNTCPLYSAHWESIDRNSDPDDYDYGVLRERCSLELQADDDEREDYLQQPGPGCPQFKGELAKPRYKRFRDRPREDV